MKKKRYFPFGYAMINGKIEIISEESNLIHQVFLKYLEGKSLQQLSSMAEQSGLLFRENTGSWNKNMIARILDDKRYWDGKQYPAIISGEVAVQAIAIRASKATPKSTYKFIHKKLACTSCKHGLTRNSKSLPRIYWDCKNCGMRWGPIADEELLKAVTEKLILVCRNPEMIEWEEVPNKNFSLQAARLTNEINQMMNQRQVDPERLMPLILECAAEKYRTCSIGESDHVTLRTKELFQNHTDDNELDQELFNQTIDKVILQADCSIKFQLFNKRTI